MQLSAKWCRAFAEELNLALHDLAATSSLAGVGRRAAAMQLNRGFICTLQDCL